MVLPAPGVPVSIMTEEGTKPSPPRASSNHERPVFFRTRRASGTEISAMFVPRFRFRMPTLRFILLIALPLTELNV